MTDDWFRSPDWTAEAREDFETRLGRARSWNRAQYLRIKGLALQEAGEPHGARELWTRVLDLPHDVSGTDRFAALEHLADSLLTEDASRAEEHLRRLVAGNPSRKGTTAMQEVTLAGLLIDRSGPSDLDEAAQLLVRWKEETHLPFPSAHFRWELAMIALAEKVGDTPAAQEAARRALDLAAQGPVFPRHRTVGVVRGDEATMKRLERLARGR